MGPLQAFDNLMGRMFGSDASPTVCDEIVATVEPRIKLVRDWRERLEPGIRRAVGVMRHCVREFAPPVELTREG